MGRGDFSAFGSSTSAVPLRAGSAHLRRARATGKVEGNRRPPGDTGRRAGLGVAGGLARVRGARPSRDQLQLRQVPPDRRAGCRGRPAQGAGGDSGAALARRLTRARDSGLGGGVRPATCIFRMFSLSTLFTMESTASCTRSCCSSAIATPRCATPAPTWPRRSPAPRRLVPPPPTSCTHAAP